MSFCETEITVSEILRTIQDAGFAAELLQKQEEKRQDEVWLAFRQGI